MGAYQNAYAKAIGKRGKKFETESYEITDFTGFQRKCFVGQIKDGSYLRKHHSPDVDMEFEPYTLQAVVVFRNDVVYRSIIFHRIVEENHCYLHKGSKWNKKRTGRCC